VSEVAPPTRARLALAWLLWPLGSCLGTVCGIGGGTFATPIQHYLLRIPLRQSVSNSLVLVFAMTLVATLVEAARGDGAIDWTVVGLLLVGSIPGTRLGYAWGKRVEVRTLKLMFVVLLLVAAVRTATLRGQGGPLENPGEVELGIWGTGMTVLIGFGGGFIAPLLGIGGGILVIPLLFLMLPDMSYLEARAASLAMSIVNSGQSVWLSVRDGRIQLERTAPMAALAVLGALAGTWLVHLPGWGEVARIALVCVLLFVAARFALDVRATRE
jgi:hypothetical protein